MLADVGRYSVREILIERGILSEREIAEIEKFKNETGWSFAKICLTLGFVSRKKWAELFKELGYEIIDIKKEKVDVKTLSYLNMLVMEQYLGVPLRKENGEVIVAMCDPTDVEFIEMVKKNFQDGSKSYILQLMLTSFGFYINISDRLFAESQFTTYFGTTRTDQLS
jgi:hypothetical protein